MYVCVCDCYIRHLAAQTKVLMLLVRGLMYADNCNLVAHTETDIPCFMYRLSDACKDVQPHGQFRQDGSDVPAFPRDSVPIYDDGK